MLSRVLEPEVMDSEAEARDYDAMDHSAVNSVFVTDLLHVWTGEGSVLDVGAGTAQIPIELCQRCPTVHVTAIDLAEHMLQVGRENVRVAGLQDRILLERVDAKQMPYASGAFRAVVSNSIIHHIPDPASVFAEMKRVVSPSGMLFVRDLLRPANERTLHALVDQYAAGANDHQRQMFGASLHAALTLDEVRAFVGTLGFPAASVAQTSDRHWTWSVRASAANR